MIHFVDVDDWPKGIPKRLKILGRTITVNLDQRNFVDTEASGFASYRLNEIQLRTSSDSFPISDEMMRVNFWHELTHFVMYHSGGSLSKDRGYVHKDEEFVDLTGNLFMQSVESFEF